jgi:hypothetical protein
LPHAKGEVCSFGLSQLSGFPRSSVLFDPPAHPSPEDFEGEADCPEEAGEEETFMNQPSDGIKLAVWVSDLHCGSSVGLMPPHYTTLQGFQVRPSYFQGWLWECWQDAMGFIKDVKGEDQLAAIINGDCTEGVHHGTKQIVSADTGDHKTIAIKCLSQLAGMADKAYMTVGTECHVGMSEVSIAKALNLQINPDFPLPEDGETPEGAYVFQRLSLKMNGIRSITRHHMPTTIRRGLGGTPLSNTLAEEQLEAANNGEEMPRVVALAHSHKTRHYSDDEGVAFVTGAWQGLTNHGHKVVSAARIKPSVYMTDWRGVPHGGMPRIHFRRYRQPAGTTISI